MSDYHVNMMVDDFGQKWVILFEMGKISRPLLMVRDYEWEKLIEEYQEDKDRADKSG